MDIIYLHGLQAEAVIGTWPWEKKLSQTLTLDIDMAVDIKLVALNDKLDDALNYQAVAKRVLELCKDSDCELIETLVEKLAESILKEFAVSWVRIKVDKGRAVKEAKQVGVVIERGKKEPA